MVYFELSILGGVIFLATAAADYVTSRDITALSVSQDNVASHPSEIPVGSTPTEVTLKQRIRLAISRIRTPIIGYLLAVILQIPFLFETAGVI